MNAAELAAYSEMLAQSRSGRMGTAQAQMDRMDSENADRNAIYERINQLPKEQREEFLRFMEQWEIQNVQEGMRQKRQNWNDRIVPYHEQYRWFAPGQRQRKLSGTLT